ncbi:MAG: hypothetical protein HY726_12760 [Candidatus Rokubacteria bacterium]|nr:hypothetical protein [Candidatus Rokubacteria bacterium]
MTGLRAAAARFSLWITPALLFSLPVELLTRGSEGLWAALLVVVAPLLGFLVTTTRSDAPPHPAFAYPLLLLGAALLWANLLLAGDVARWLGFSRAIGILVASASAVVLTASDAGRRRGLALAAAALLAVFLPLGVVSARAGRLPLEAWSHAASLPAFRFSATSPWVTEGRPVVLSPGTDALVFEDEHRVTSVDAGPLRILVNDAGRARVQEWKLAANQSVTLRPGDGLLIEPGQRLRFEANKRIPGAPASGVSWADPPRLSPGPELLSVVGLGLTMIGGAAALLSSGGVGPISRATAVLAGIGYLLVLAWAQGWATYTLTLAPDLFLGGVTAEKLVELPALAFAGDLWGRGLDGVLLLGGFLALLASVTALRDLLARGGVGGDWGLWGGILAAALLAALWPEDPWRGLLIAFGLGASTLAPVIWAGSSPEPPWAIGLALGAGVFIFLALTVAGELLAVEGTWGRIILSYPALAAAPATAVILRLGGRVAG